MHWKQLLLALLAFLTLWSGLMAPAANAQAPKVGDYFVDDSDLGFKIKMPKDWSFIPPKVGENNLLGKYNPNNQVAVPSGRNTSIYLECWMVKFDRRAKSKRTLDIEVDGEMQADTALIAAVRQRKLPSSTLKGEANLLVMPGLTSANVAYQIMKVFGDALPVGPILLGTALPAHILTGSVTSRGVVNMTAIAVAEAATRAKA